MRERLRSFPIYSFALVAIAACQGAAAIEQAATPAPADGGSTTPIATTTDTTAPTSSSTAAPDAATPPLDAGPPPGLTVPPPFPTYSHGTCPTLVTGSTQSTSFNANFSSGSQSRNFYVIVPPSYDGTKKLPVLFAWHWLNAGPESFIRDGELESTAQQMDFIVVVPDHLRNNDNKVYQFDWPFVETWGVDSELTFVDDMLACVDANLQVDHERVYGIGVSAGGLWMTFVSTTDRANHFAAIESLSGGLGADPVGFWKMTYKPQPKKFASLVLWGGPTDNLGLDFQAASIKYRDELKKDGHFVVQCTHDKGHAVPPIESPIDGGTKFQSLWQFMLDHPYGTAAGQSPYLTTGLPSVYPSWCSLVP